jgi:hypothetical protein
LVLAPLSSLAIAFAVIHLLFSILFFSHPRSRTLVGLFIYSYMQIMKTTINYVHCVPVTKPDLCLEMAASTVRLAFDSAGLDCAWCLFLASTWVPVALDCSIRVCA